MHHPLVRPAATFVAVGTGLALVLVLAGVTVRALPWLLDPALPWPVAAPFVRALAVGAAEASLVLGWPLGWAFAVGRAVERGEARVLELLGLAPSAALRALAPQAGAVAVALALVSLGASASAGAPGRVVGELLLQGRAACTASPGGAPRTVPVPFTGLAWACVGAAEPRLAGVAPLGGAVVSARAARLSDDLRRIELDDAQLGLGAGARVHVGTLVLRGLPPFVRASSVPPFVRALAVAVAAAVGAACAALGLLRARALLRGPVRGIAVGVGAVPGLAALGVLRALERLVPEAPHAGWLVAYVLLPAIAGALPLALPRVARGALALVAARARSRPRPEGQLA